jgi:hypothetical protein
MSSEQPAKAETKACPKCGETILAVAIVCKHCRSDIGPQQQAAMNQWGPSPGYGPPPGPPAYHRANPSASATPIPPYAKKLAWALAMLMAFGIVAAIAQASLVFGIAAALAGLAVAGITIAAKVMGSPPPIIKRVGTGLGRHPLAVAACAGVLVVGGIRGGYRGFSMRHAVVRECDDAVAFFLAMKGSGQQAMPSDQAMQRLAEWKAKAEDGRRACEEAGMTDQASGLGAASAAIDRQVSAGQQTIDQAAAAQKAAADQAAAEARERSAVETFPARAKQIATMLAGAAAKAAAGKWTEADEGLTEAQTALGEFAGTSIEKSKGWADLTAKVTAQRKKIQPQLDRIADAKREAATKVQVEEALRGDEINAKVKATMAIQEAMHNPDSFKEVEQIAIARGEFWVVTTKYRGTNGFGAVVTDTTTLCANKLTVGKCP